MADWGPVVIAVLLFVLLSPGLLFQIPSKENLVGFATMKTSGISIFIHTFIFFGLMVLFSVIIGVQIKV
ncbi:hypothetical protein MKW92_052367 [Papaver armeniacum]|nr:hypothetical protein MKW92_052367 [Papaver armeniacum]